MASNKSPVEESNTWEEKYGQTGFWNISSLAQQKVAAKRKRKGLSDLQPREKSVIGQLVVYGTAYTVAKVLVAPLERVRLIQQTSHMQNLKQAAQLHTFKGVYSSKASMESSTYRD